MFEDRTYGPIEYQIGQSRIVHTCREHWIKGHSSIPARCGISGTLKFENSRGVTTREMRSLESTLESSIGVEGLAALKSRVAEKIGTEVQISEQSTVTLSLEFPAAKCGSVIYHPYNQVRDHRFDIHKPRLLRPPQVTPETLREYVGEYDFKIEPQPDDPNCPCDPPEFDRPFMGLARACANRLRLTFEYYQRADGHAEIDFGKASYALEGNELKLPASTFPKGWAELADLAINDEVLCLPVEYPLAESHEFALASEVVVPQDFGVDEDEGGSTPQAT